MRRRTVLAGIATGVTAGCLSRQPQAWIGRLVIANYTTAAVSVTVSISDGLEVVYEQTHDVPGDDDPDDVRVPSVALVDDLPDDPGGYVVRYGLAGESLKRFDFAARVERGCGQLHVDVREDERVELFYSDSCDTLSPSESA